MCSSKPNYQYFVTIAISQTIVLKQLKRNEIYFYVLFLMLINSLDVKSLFTISFYRMDSP